MLFQILNRQIRMRIVMMRTLVQQHWRKKRLLFHLLQSITIKV